jgi:hypothetical protein
LAQELIGTDDVGRDVSETVDVQFRRNNLQKQDADVSFRMLCSILVRQAIILSIREPQSWVSAIHWAFWRILYVGKLGLDQQNLS